jgi:uncharacterized repeat protein (TIGR02543 family)
MLTKLFEKNHCVFAVLLSFFLSTSIYADEYLVTSSNVDSMLSVASPGDTIILINGTYTNKVLTLNQSGTNGNPIVFKAQTLGGVIFNGSSSRIAIQGDYWIIDGFRWEDVLTTSSTAVIYFNGASNNVFKNNTVYNSGRTTVGSKTGIIRLMNTSQNNVIEYNRFDSIVNIGIQVWAWDTDNSNTGNIIRYNYFVNHYTFELLQLGQGGASAFVDQYTVVEHNLFENIDMEDPELISSKTSFNHIRYNTFRNCRSMLVLRTGQSSTVEGNWFLNSHGIRVHDKNHLIINNYIEGNAGDTSSDNEGIVLYSGNQVRPNSDGSHYPADSVLVANNTIINHMDEHIMVGKHSGTWAYDPNGVFIKNNLVTNDAGTAILNEASINSTWSQNIAYPTGTGSAGNVGNVINSDPQLSLIGEIYKLQSGSPAIDSASAEVLVSIDIEGQARDDLDIGADEYSAATILYGPLDSTDVGPGVGDGVTSFTLSTGVTGVGSINLDPSGGIYDSATIVVVTAVPADGYEFNNWSGDRSGSTNPLSITMDDDISITANFLIDADSLSILPVDSVWATNDDGNIPENTLDNNLGTRWSAEGTQSITYKLDSLFNVQYLMIAWFNGDQRSSYFDIAVSGDGVSWATVATDTSSATTIQQEMVDVPDTTVLYVRYIGYGNSVSNWNSITEVDIYGTTGIGTGAPQYTLSTVAIGSGSIGLNPSGGTYDSSTVVTVTAIADSGYVFDGWSGDRSGSTNPLLVTMDSSINITATFIPEYTLSTSVVGLGSLGLNPTGGVYDSATVVIVTATADSGYVFDSWSGDRSGNTNPLSLTMDSNINITATFTESGGGSDTVIILANHDAHVRGGEYGDTNYGSDTKLRLKLTAPKYTYYTLIQMDCSSEGLSDCTSATLRLDMKYVQGTHTITLYKTTDNWDESTVTYNNAPAPGDPIDTITITSVGLYEIDVTDYVADELAGNDTVSFFFVGGSVNNYSNSSETAFGPELVITSNSVKSASVEKKLSEPIKRLQNYPNPFHNYTNISFELPSPGRVRLEVFNINGGKIETLVNKNLSQGNHTYQWKPGNNTANISGIYFYRLTTPYGQKTNKMNYVRIK